MTLDAPFALLTTMLLVIVRASAFLAIAPPFSSRSVPARVKVGLAVALALPVTPQLVATAPPPELAALASAVAFQLASGLTMGFIAMVLMAAIQAAGELIDLFGFFSMASILDPLSNTMSSMFGRIQQLIGITLLFASNGHLLMVRGFLSSFELMPLRTPDLGELSRLLIHDLGLMVVAALEICGPVVIVLFCADLAMGLLSRAVPTLNVFQLSFPIKTILTVSMAALAIALLPAAVAVSVDRVITQFQPAARLLGG